MARYSLPFNPANAQIHCLAHVVNLVVQKVLKLAGEVQDDPDLADYYELFLKHLSFHFNIDEDEDLQAWEEEEYDDESCAVPEEDEEEEEETASTALEKVCPFYIHSCSQTDTAVVASLAHTQDHVFAAEPRPLPRERDQALRWPIYGQGCRHLSSHGYHGHARSLEFYAGYDGPRPSSS